MQRARRGHKPIAFLMVDLDHFKGVNDSYGHLQGDAVLAELASIISTGARESDVCARYGGEGVALLPPPNKKAGARNLSARVSRTVGAPTMPPGRALPNRLRGAG